MTTEKKIIIDEGLQKKGGLNRNRPITNKKPPEPKPQRPNKNK